MRFKIRRYIAKHNNLFKVFDVRYYSYLVALEYAKRNNISHHEKFVVFASFRKVLTLFIQTVELLFIGYLIGHSIEMLIVLVFISILREFAGGFHAKSTIECMMVTTIFMLASIYFGKIITFNTGIVLLIISVILIVSYAPRQHPKEKILDIKGRRKAKYKSLVAFGILVTLAYFIPFFNHFYGVIILALFIESANLINIKCCAAQ